VSDSLAAIRAFAGTIGRQPWFAACGEPLGEIDHAEARLYVAALGLGELPVIGVASWAKAAQVTQHPDWSKAWWQAETRARTDLQKRAAARYGGAPVLAALSAVAAASANLHGAAALAAGGAGTNDPALTRVAAGAAAQACHQVALAIGCDAGPEHLFAIKYRLFAAGRWPLGVVGQRCFVF
jgi:hypothetical protein